LIQITLLAKDAAGELKKYIAVADGDFKDVNITGINKDQPSLLKEIK